MRLLFKYKTPWLDSQAYDFVWKQTHLWDILILVLKFLKKHNILGFPLYVIEIPGNLIGQEVH